MREEIRTDTFGRPQGLDDRLAAYTACLATGSLHASASNLQAMAFWDESVSASLVGPIATVGFDRTAKGPWSREVNGATGRLEIAGYLSRDPTIDPAASDALHPSPALFAKGLEILESAWGRRMNAFVEGLVSDAERMGFADASSDVSMAVKCDPAYRSRGWETDGPGGTVVDLGTVHPSLSGTYGNPTEGSFRLWLSAAIGTGGVLAPTMDMAATAYGMFVAGIAAREEPTFADAKQAALATRTTVRENEVDADGRTLVEATFMEGDEAVAWATFETRTRVKESFRDGSTMRTEEPDGTLVDVRVSPGRRREGFGTLALRHAVARGCVRSPAPTREAARLFAKHGNPRHDGGHDLCRIGWPLVRSLAERSTSDRNERFATSL